MTVADFLILNPLTPTSNYPYNNKAKLKSWGFRGIDHFRVGVDRNHP